MNNLKRIDLNLLLTLDVLLTEKNVTRAAEKLHLAQPSVSVQLAKLRELLGDPLLLPGPRGMRPTARADELREPLRQALEALDRAVSPAAPFDPARADHTWRIDASDYGESTIVLPALRSLRTAAPGTRLAVLDSAPTEVARQAERGEIDLAFHTTDDAPPTLRRRALFMERYVLAGRTGHPRLKRRPSASQFCALEHVIVSPDGGGFRGPTDEALSALGLTRRVVLSVPHFLFLSSALLNSDLVAVMPERLAREAPGLRIVEPPVTVPGFEMSMLWHERLHRDPAHQWLREHIAHSV
ncbi:LysR family transcriptional regulator [Trinickia caryophylli]|uniref:Transcriptional regulator, LysR family n=1 Tax=Trinickia caryophylli TaxID=28094 RepID=A0A1X7FS53_TRICW|nr:LysR family transcriptional regulator [Trinickia caryophylli]PMS11981.1 LysR family transcriptional regulator [Trinickia caryophylli]TRX13940.1 LysR family transcriptional regulator [Trinickia caryophylli]WQE15535.1 LysR family transcriptional regulator [Trinickia caryophylli]SMF57477.1 transcriptional regulator, LysR family [Trinickia caryophylli]GLU33714.1 LysR family transcriptional regulator [Trinickia caryophylli]